VISQDTNAEFPYILEELIIGRSFGLTDDWVLLVDKVLPSLFRFYDQEYIRHCPAVELYDSERIYRVVTNSFYNFYEDKKWMLPSELFLKNVDQCLRFRDETLPVCTGHGDLNRNNFVVAIDGGIVLLDWECSRKLPIAEEVIKLVPVLLSKYPQLMHRLALELRQRTEDPIVMPPKRQVLLAALEKIATNADRSRRFSRWLKVASNLITGPDW
jgi:thiamine kinase-like enzyme